LTGEIGLFCGRYTGLDCWKSTAVEGNIRLFYRGGAPSREYIALSREVYSSFTGNLGLLCVGTTVFGARDGTVLREIQSFVSSCIISGRFTALLREIWEFFVWEPLFLGQETEIFCGKYKAFLVHA